MVDAFRVDHGPQYVVPSCDLQTLWVTNNAECRTLGLTPVDPPTGKAGDLIRWTTRTTCTFRPTENRGMVVAEARRRLDLRG